MTAVAFAVFIVYACAVLLTGVIVLTIGIVRFVRSRFASGYYGPERRTHRVLPTITYGVRDDT